MQRIPYVCPITREPLRQARDGLVRADGAMYPCLPMPQQTSDFVPNFLDIAALGEGQRASLAMYGESSAVEIYRNFLGWLFSTFEESETAWRQTMTRRLQLGLGNSVLVTGCGLGDDLAAISDIIGPGGEVYAQDLSPAMILGAVQARSGNLGNQSTPIFFSVGDASSLPFSDDSFDAAFHFGGINLFDDIRAAIREMARVVRAGGRVVFGDEGIAPWLRDTDYGRMVVTNNPLWSKVAPVELLPAEANDVTVEWVLGQCFWVIGFTKATSLPRINPHVRHQGRRGGTMWTRQYGQLEGVTPETKALIQKAAAAAGMAEHDWLENALRQQLAASSNPP